MNTTLFAILTFQALLGAFDNFWHHELQARLPQRQSARHELLLHAARELIYAIVFMGLAWFEWRGAFAWLLGGLLVTELFITLADFLEEDRSRQLPPLERVLHTVLTLSFGAFLAMMAPLLMRWSELPTQLYLHDHGWVTWMFSLFSLAVLGWSVRNALAFVQLGRQVSDEPGTPRQGASLTPPPTVLVTGGTGFLGQNLVRALVGAGSRVIVLSRDARQARAQFGPAVWVIERLDAIPSETRVDAIVNLAGAPVLGLPWSAARRRELLGSRVQMAEALVALMRRLHRTPATLICASAQGFYGRMDAAPGQADETAPPQPGQFQSDLCVTIEHEARRAEALKVRVVRLRLAIVLGHGGGAYPGLALAARMGLGAVLGNGRQAAPWIHLEDAVGLIRYALNTPQLQGAVNALAPDTRTQAEFSTALAQSFGRSAWLRLPYRLMHTLMGEMSELLLEGQWQCPRAALDAGYVFRHAHLDTALSSLAGIKASVKSHA